MFVMAGVVFVRSRAEDTGVGLMALDLPPTSRRSFATRSFRVSACASSSSAALALSSALAGIALGDLIHLGDGGIDLLDTLRLLASGSGDFRDKRVGRAHLLGDLRERLLYLGRALRSLSTVDDRRLDLVRCLLGGGGAPLASDRTSSATTAKPAPASPARAASTAALRARMFVWKAISSIFLTILATSALTNRSPPSHASFRPSSLNRLPPRAAELRRLALWPFRHFPLLRGSCWTFLRATCSSPLRMRLAHWPRKRVYNSPSTPAGPPRRSGAPRSVDRDVLEGLVC